MNTSTKVRFRAQSQLCQSEKDAYVWMLDKYIGEKGDFFGAQPDTIRTYLAGTRGGVLFSPSSNQLNHSESLRNGWFAETCPNEHQKVANLYLLAQAIGMSWKRDVEWQAEGRPTIQHKDVGTLLAELTML